MIDTERSDVTGTRGGTKGENVELWRRMFLGKMISCDPTRGIGGIRTTRLGRRMDCCGDRNAEKGAGLLGMLRSNILVQWYRRGVMRDVGAVGQRNDSRAALRDVETGNREEGGEGERESRSKISGEGHALPAERYAARLVHYRSHWKQQRQYFQVGRFREITSNELNARLCSNPGRRRNPVTPVGSGDEAVVAMSGRGNGVPKRESCGLT